MTSEGRASCSCESSLPRSSICSALRSSARNGSSPATYADTGPALRGFRKNDANLIKGVRKPGRRFEANTSVVHAGRERRKAVTFRSDTGTRGVSPVPPWRSRPRDSAPSSSLQLGVRATRSTSHVASLTCKPRVFVVEMQYFYLRVFRDFTVACAGCNGESQRVFRIIRGFRASRVFPRTGCCSATPRLHRLVGNEGAALARDTGFKVQLVSSDFDDNVSGRTTRRLLSHRNQEGAKTC